MHHTLESLTLKCSDPPAEHFVVSSRDGKTHTHTLAASLRRVHSANLICGSLIKMKEARGGRKRRKIMKIRREALEGE